MPSPSAESRREGASQRSVKRPFLSLAHRLGTVPALAAARGGGPLETGAWWTLDAELRGAARAARLAGRWLGLGGAGLVPGRTAVAQLADAAEVEPCQVRAVPREVSVPI